MPLSSFPTCPVRCYCHWVPLFFLLPGQDTYFTGTRTRTHAYLRVFLLVLHVAYCVLLPPMRTARFCAAACGSLLLFFLPYRDGFHAPLPPRFILPHLSCAACTFWFHTTTTRRMVHHCSCILLLLSARAACLPAPAALHLPPDIAYICAYRFVSCKGCHALRLLPAPPPHYHAPPSSSAACSGAVGSTILYMCAQCAVCVWFACGLGWMIHRFVSTCARTWFPSLCHHACTLPALPAACLPCTPPHLPAFVSCTF